MYVRMCAYDVIWLFDITAIYLKIFRDISLQALQFLKLLSINLLDPDLHVV